MGRLASGGTTNCGHCGQPLWNPKGKWVGKMPMGLACWLCLPCEYLYISERVKGGDPLDGFEVPASFKPEWNQ